MLRVGALRIASSRAGGASRILSTWRASTCSFSTSTVGTNDDDSTPAETKLTFLSEAYGKDPASSTELTSSQIATTEKLKHSIVEPASNPVSASKVNDARAMFDSSLPQQAEDGKSADTIKRDVTPETPDATRVAFKFVDYGKDPAAASEETAQEANQTGELQARVGDPAPAGFTASPLHDTRSMFDSDLTQGAGTEPTADSIKREVEANTPDLTRMELRVSAYGKDPQAANELSEQETAEIEALRTRVSARASGASPIHDDRNMFDSELIHGAGSAPSSGSIKREIVADTPETTRLVFGGSDYGKDPESMRRSPEEQAAMDALASRATRSKDAMDESGAAPIHHPRSMYDSDLTHSIGAVVDPDSIKRDVSAGTPVNTRLAFGGSDYGKDPGSMARTAEEQAQLDGLAVTSEGARAVQRPAAPVHDNRSMFDSDLAHGAGAARTSDSIKRDVSPETPELTRLSFFASTCEYPLSCMTQSPGVYSHADVQDPYALLGNEL